MGQEERGRNQKCTSESVPTVHSVSHFPAFSFPSLSPPRSGSSNPVQGFGERCQPPAREDDIWSQQTRSLGSKYIKNVFAVRCLVAANVVLFPLNDIKQDAQLSQRDRAAGCVIVCAKSRTLELGDNDLRTL